MKRRVALSSLLVLSVTSQASAENGWQELGGILSQACGAAQGGNTSVGGVNIPLGQAGEKMKWLCQLNQIHAFVNNSILNGDWEGFAKDVAGKYIGRLANSAASGLNTSGLDATLTKLNQAMQKDYGTFRAALAYAG